MTWEKYGGKADRWSETAYADANAYLAPSSCDSKFQLPDYC